ncbi:MAG: hypothetical protein IJG09_07965 [Methanobrevibacter sp.]|nr:hypothetical protein [Methanobrevibacter sp.]
MVDILQILNIALIIVLAILLWNNRHSKNQLVFRIVFILIVISFILTGLFF